MSTSEASQRIQAALARGELDECLDQFDEAWHGSSVPSLVDWLAQFGMLSDLALREQLIGELIKIDLERRWRRPLELVAVEQGANSAQTQVRRISGLPARPIIEDYRQALGPAWPFSNLPVDLLTEEYRVRQKWGDAPSASTYQPRCPDSWPRLRDALAQVDAEISRNGVNSTVQSHASSPSAASNKLRIELQVGDEIDDFRLLNILGEGAFAKVFLAQQKSMQRLVALKITQHRSAESPVLSQLDHPNIVRVYDERSSGPYTLMYMQFVPGDILRFAVNLRSSSAHRLRGQDYFRGLNESLVAKGLATSHRVAESSLHNFQWGELIAWLGSRLYAALAHAHDCGVYHRDVKPENILVTADGEPMLLDFNLSFGQHLDGSSIEDSFGGSLAYMSPEQLSSVLGWTPISSVGAASDVYSLAIVLFELLFGVRPETAHWVTPEDLLAARTQPAPWPASAAMDTFAWAPGVRANLLAALAPHPDARPTAAQLSQRLRVCFHPRLRDIYYPHPRSWNAWIVRHPLRSLIGFGLLPNICVSVVNIWANDRLTTYNFDQHFFDYTEKPVVNLVAYTLGVVGSLMILVPIMRDLGNSTLSLAERQTLAGKTLRTPLLSSLLILFLWVASGLAFPLWNRWSPASQVGVLDIAGFVISQIIHGLIAAVSTFVVTSKVITESILPKYYTADAPCIPESQFTWCTGLLRSASSIMAVTPLLAVFALAVSDQFDRTVFVVLAIVGFAGHLFTSALVPAVISKLEALSTLNLSKRN